MSVEKMTKKKKVRGNLYMQGQQNKNEDREKNEKREREKEGAWLGRLTLYLINQGERGTGKAVEGTFALLSSQGLAV